MKHCQNCEFYLREMYQFPNGQQGLASVCSYSECSDPVDGSPVPCGIARKEEVFCGFKGKYFKAKQEEPKGSILELAKP